MIEDFDSLLQEISELKKRTEILERENILILSRIEELERSNVSNLNMLFQISNNLEEKIENLEMPTNYDTNSNYIVEHL
jgi:hypothetical protein